MIAAALISWVVTIILWRVAKRARKNLSTLEETLLELAMEVPRRLAIVVIILTFSFMASTILTIMTLVELMGMGG